MENSQSDALLHVLGDKTYFTLQYSVFNTGSLNGSDRRVEGD